MKRNFLFKKSGLSNTSKVAFLLSVILIGGFGHSIKRTELITALDNTKEVLQSSVLLNNEKAVIPLRNLSVRKIASVNIGNPNSFAFNEMLENYAPIKSFNFPITATADFNSCSTVIVQVSAASLLSSDVLSFINQASQTKEVIVAGFGPSVSLQKFDNLSLPIVWNPEQNPIAAQHSAQIIFGGEAISSKLPVSISTKYIAGSGFSTQKTRLGYINSDFQGINFSKLNKIDAIVNEAIAERATPGAVVMVVKDGRVVFDKAYGSHTYGEDVPTKVNDIFDLASVTKIASTTIATMKLFDENKIDLNAGLGTYLEDLKGTNKDYIPVRDVMLHQAGLVNLDFLSYVKPQDHSSDSSFFFPIKITDNYYLRRDFYKDVMWPKMVRSPLPTRGQYVYSDLSMFMMKEVIEHQSGTTLDKFVLNNFYRPLGMKTAGYLPLQRFNKDQIVPTERDTYFRRTLLQGYVHDSGASLANGVSGHAGLFASANDLAILNQMLLNGGQYGGEAFLKPETIHLFTSSQSNVSRRGLGFDRGNGSSYPCHYSSNETFGHTGYTGTCVWVDPKENLIYIFLSNRVYPNASNKLNSLGIRARIQDVIYEAIAEGKRNFAGVSNSK